MSQPNNRPEKRRLNPRKLLLSKWTAAQPQNRERHFLVTELIRDEQDNILGVELQRSSRNAASNSTGTSCRTANAGCKAGADPPVIPGGGPLGWRRLPAQKNQYQTYTKYLTCITAHL